MGSEFSNPTKNNIFCEEDDYFDEVSVLEVRTDPGELSEEELDLLVASDFPNRTGLKDVVRECASIFTALSPADYIEVPPIALELKPGYSFKSFHPRRVNPAILAALQKEITTLQELGYIYPTTSPMASPIVIVPKPNGDIRLCVDYKIWLNSIIVEPRYPLPYVDDILGRLAGKKYFFKLDLSRGFHQLRISDESQYLTAFICPLGTFAFTRLPFGISSAPMIFQSIMEQILAPVRDEIAGNLIDDIVGGADDEPTLFRLLRKVFNLLREYNVHLSVSKCQLGSTSMIVLGHVVSSEGVSMIPSRKEHILSIPAPTNVRLLRRFIGMTNYFKRFIPDYATIIQPLTKVTSGFSWSSEQEQAFQKVKEAIAATTVLFHIDYTLPIVLRVDASTYGVGGALLNVLPGGEERIIQFFSTAFSGAAQRWSVIEKEAYAAVYGMLTLAPYLWGVHFFLETDHRNLMWLYKATAPKLIRWRLRIQAFNFTVRHIPGATNIFADEMSRVVRSSASDEVQLFPVQVLCRGESVAEDPSELLSRFHSEVSGHLGLRATLSKLRQAGYSWSTMHDDVHAFIASCPICQKIRGVDDQPPAPTLHRHTFEPFACVAVDTVGPLPVAEDGSKYIIVIIDEFSRYTLLFSSKSTSALEAAHALHQTTGRFGLIGSIMTDQGTQYANAILDEYCSFWNISKRMSLPYRPQANGIVERANQEIMRHLRAIVFHRRVIDHWPVYLPMVELIVNSAYHSALGTAPFRIIFGDSISPQRGLLTCWDALSHKDSQSIPITDYVRQLSEQLEAVAEASRSHQSQSWDSRRLKNSKTPRQFAVGDFVLVNYPSRPPSKLSPRWRGPYRVVERKNNTYTVIDLVSQQITYFDASRIIPWHDRSDPMSDSATNTRYDAALRDNDEYVVEKIVDHHGNPSRPASLDFRVRWLGYAPEEDTWLPYREVKDLAALDEYLAAHPELKL